MQAPVKKTSQSESEGGGLTNLATGRPAGYVGSNYGRGLYHSRYQADCGLPSAGTENCIKDRRRGAQESLAMRLRAVYLRKQSAMIRQNCVAVRRSLHER